jgi:hypothetical protein
MLKGLVLAAAVAALVVVATGRVDDIRSEVSGLRVNWFDAMNSGRSQAEKQKKEWAEVAREANSICAEYHEQELVIRLSLPQNRADYLDALGVAIGREREMQARLSAVQTPPYDVSYPKFLRDRQMAIAAMDRLRAAVKEKRRRDFVLAARALVRAQASINPYVQSAGMPACVA